MAEEQLALPIMDDAALFKGATESPPAEEAGTSPPPSPPTETVSPVEGGGGPPENVPSWRLREEAEARRLADQRASKAEAELETLIQAIKDDASRATPPQQEGAPSDFFADPEKSVQTLILQAVKPIAEALQHHRQQSDMALSRLFAVQEHTGKVVKEAESAFLKAMNDRTLDVMEYEAVVQSPNRFDAVVKWHDNAKVRATVGKDPEAFFMNKLKEKVADQSFQTELLNMIRGTASNGAGSSVVQLPPSLSGVTSAARSSVEDRGDMSDASLFHYARNSK